MVACLCAATRVKDAAQRLQPVSSHTGWAGGTRRHWVGWEGQAGTLARTFSFFSLRCRFSFGGCISAPSRGSSACRTRQTPHRHPDREPSQARRQAEGWAGCSPSVAQPPTPSQPCSCNSIAPQLLARCTPCQQPARPPAHAGAPAPAAAACWETAARWCAAAAQRPPPGCGCAGHDPRQG